MKKRLAGDFVYTFSALLTVNLILQVIIYPLINRFYSAEALGDIVYYSGIIYTVSASVGGAISNQKLLLREKYDKTNSDFNTITVGVNIVIFIALFIMSMLSDNSILNAVLYAVSGCLVFMRYYAEVEFIKAEILARTGDYPSARLELDKAILATFENVNATVESAQQFPDIYGYGVYGPVYAGEYLSAADASDYSARVFGTLADEELLKEIMIQKYLFFHNANGGAVEAYNDVRRLKAAGEDFITLANPKNAAGKFPLRCGYGSSDTTTNPNVQAAFGDGSYVYTEPVWWALGSK